MCRTARIFGRKSCISIRKTNFRYYIYIGFFFFTGVFCLLLSFKPFWIVFRSNKMDIRTAEGSSHGSSSERVCSCWSRRTICKFIEVLCSPCMYFLSVIFEIWNNCSVPDTTSWFTICDLRCLLYYWCRNWWLWSIWRALAFSISTKRVGKGIISLITILIEIDLLVEFSGLILYYCFSFYLTDSLRNEEKSIPFKSLESWKPRLSTLNLSKLRQSFSKCLT